MSDNETSEGNPRCYHDDPEEVPVSPDQMQLLEVPNGNRPHRNHDGAGMSGNNTSRMRYEGEGYTAKCLRFLMSLSNFTITG